MVFVLSLILCVSAFAASAPVYDQKTTWWHWVKDVPFLGDWVAYRLGAVCPNSEDKYHHASTYQSVHEDGYFTCICTYCGQEFIAYESDLKQSYQQQVDSLPASGYNSDGSLLWSPALKYINALYITGAGFSWTSHYKACPHFSTDNSTYVPDAPFVANFDCDNLSVSIRPESGSSGFNFTRGFFVFSDIYPVSGFYTLLDTPSWKGYSISSSGDRVEYNRSFGEHTAVYYGAKEKYLYNLEFLNSGKVFRFVSIQGFVPVYEIIPDTAIDTTLSGPYGINSRPTTITGGNYGIVGDNGQITTINNNQQIINETNNTYYNPATGQTVPILNWTYDYGDRIYTLELEGSVTVDVRYGDENITITENTINEGDTIVNNYTIYYIIDGGSGETPGPSPTPGPEATPCPHAWAETSRTDPSCTAPGSASFSCSKCGETKTDKLPATGHTWQILRTVQTAYDEEGNLVQQGYTIYQCAVCSEQYKDDQGTGPPGGGGSTGEDKETIWDKIANFFGSIVDGIAGIFEAILGKLLDALTALSEMLMGKVKDVVEVVLSVLDEVPKLFDGFLNFLGVVFPFIPAEITLLLTFGVIAVVFIGIIKAIRR